MKAHPFPPLLWAAITAALLLLSLLSAQPHALAAESPCVQLYCTAIDITAQGPAALKKTHDPYSKKPFAYQENEPGFTLTSAYLYQGKALSLTIP